MIIKAVNDLRPQDAVAINRRLSEIKHEHVPADIQFTSWLDYAEQIHADIYNDCTFDNDKGMPCTYDFNAEFPSVHVQGSDISRDLTKHDVAKIIDNSRPLP